MQTDTGWFYFKENNFTTYNLADYNFINVFFKVQ